MKPRSTMYYSNQIIGPIIAWLAEHRGSRAELLRRMEKIHGSKIHASLMTRWFNPDPEQRTEPLFGIALLAVKCFNQMKREHIRIVSLDASLSRREASKIDPAEIDLPPGKDESAPDPQPSTGGS